MATWTENSLRLPGIMWVQTLDGVYTCYARRLTDTEVNLRMIDADNNIILNDVLPLTEGQPGPKPLNDLPAWKEIFINRIA